MASIVSSYKSKQMERLQTCPICLDKFRIPKILPCMHAFCLTPCLTNLVDPRARSLNCPECRREHQIPPGGVQAFPAYVPMVAVRDLQPTTTMSTTMIDLPDRCFICKQRKQTLIECQDCSQFLCIDCREPHLHEAFYNIRSSVSQLRRTLPKLNEKMASYEQQVNNVKTNSEQIRREITLNIAALIDELKHREATLLTEAEAHMQSQLRAFHNQQEPVELAGVANFCQSIETLNPNTQLINDTDLANMRAQCNRYSQQIDALQVQMPTNTQKNFGRLIDPTQERQQQQPRFSSTNPQTAARYVRTSQNSRRNSRQSQNDQYQYSENFYGARGSMTSYVSLPDLSSTLPARLNASSNSAPRNSRTGHRGTSNLQSSIFGSNPFAAANSQAEEAEERSSAPETSPRRQFVTSMNAARSLEGDDRPIFGGSGGAGGGGGRGGGGSRGRGRFPSIAPIPEHEPLRNRFQRRGTFVLDEPSLPNLPQSGAQRPRDTVNVQDLYKVRRRKRARTPVAFTINLNDPPPSRASEIIDSGTV